MVWTCLSQTLIQKVQLSIHAVTEALFHSRSFSTQYISNSIKIGWGGLIGFASPFCGIVNYSNLKETIIFGNSFSVMLRPTVLLLLRLINCLSWRMSVSVNGLLSWLLDDVSPLIPILTKKQMIFLLLMLCSGRPLSWTEVFWS